MPNTLVNILVWKKEDYFQKPDFSGFFSFITIMRL